MAGETKPSLDELLKACAQRRREAIPEPLEIHPATRTLLLQEASRIWPAKTPIAQAKAKGWPVWWPGLAWAGGVLVVTILLFALVRSVRPPAQMDLAQANESARRQLSLEQQPEMDGLKPTSATPASAPSAPPSATVKTAPVAAQAPTRMVEPEPKAQMPPQRFGLTLDRTNPSDSTAVSLTASSQTRRDTSRTVQSASLDRPSQRSNLAVAQQFQQVNLRARYRMNFNSPQAPAILETFNFEQMSDGQLRIIDRDGSIYEGNIQPVTFSQAYASSAPSEGMPADTLSNIARQPALPPDTPGEGWRHYQFEAWGTSRALGQPVRFQGTYSVADLPTAGSLTRSSSPPSAKAVTSRIPPPQARVVGTVNIARTNQLPVEANLVGP